MPCPDHFSQFGEITLRKWEEGKIPQGIISDEHKQMLGTQAEEKRLVIEFSDPKSVEKALAESEEDRDFSLEVCKKKFARYMGGQRHITPAFTGTEGYTMAYRGMREIQENPFLCQVIRTVTEREALAREKFDKEIREEVLAERDLSPIRRSLEKVRTRSPPRDLREDPEEDLQMQKEDFSTQLHKQVARTAGVSTIEAWETPF